MLVKTQVLDAYEKTQEEEPASEAYERSELLLYKASVLAEGGKAADALALLDANQVGHLKSLGHSNVITMQRHMPSWPREKPSALALPNFCKCLSKTRLPGQKMVVKQQGASVVCCCAGTVRVLITSNCMHAQDKILDELAALEIRAQLLLDLDRKAEAAKLYRCLAHVEALHACMQL